MSWGERSCLEPCRCPHNRRIETCNVGCNCYIWDKKTKPDTKSEDIMKGLKVAPFLRELGINANDFFGRDYSDVIDKVDLEKEYELVKNKKSSLSRNQRDWVVQKYESLIHKE